MKDRKSILLVEDEALIAIAGKRTLEKSGYAVRVVTSGEAAVDAVASSAIPVDLILMDINLGPGMDGIEAAEIILRQREVPLVFLSAHTEPEVVTRTEKITSYGYIVKDSGETVLLASIRMAFRLFEAHRLLREHSQYLDATLQTTVDGFWVVDSLGNIVEVNEAYCRMSGYSREQLLSMHVSDLDVNDSRSVIAERLQRVRANGSELFETRHRRRNGDFVDTEISTSFLDREGGHFICFCRDIGDRKQADDTLRSHEELKSLLTSLARDMVNIPLDEVDCTIRRMLADVGRYTGFDRVFVFRNDWDQGVSVNTFEWCAPGIEPEIANLQAVPLEDIATVLEVHRRGERFVVPTVQGLPKNDPIRHLLEPQGIQSNLLLPLYQNGVYSGYVGFDAVRCPRDFAEDTVELLAIMAELIGAIQSRQAAELLLRLERQRLSEILEGTGAGSWEWNLQTGDVIINDRWAEIIGYTRKELLPVTIDASTSYLLSEDIPVFRKAIEKHLRGETDQYEAEVRIRHRDGRWVWVLDRGRVVSHSTDGDPLMIMGIRLDITSRKRAEQLLKDDARRFRSLLDGIRGVPVQSVGPDGEVLYWNTASEALYGYTEVEALGRNILDLVVPPELHDAVKANIAAAFGSGPPADATEDWLIRKDGSRVGVRTSFAVVDVPGRPRELFTIDVDVTEQRSAEEHARRLLREKETLIKEVQHRIKNIMNTMSSFLSLQANSIDDPVAVAALSDARSRFQSMAVLYDQLYRAEAHDHGSAGEYLGELVRKAIALFPGGDAVTLQVMCDDFSLDVKQLSVVGMIVNELVINAMKYAFTDVSAGAVRLISLEAHLLAGQLTVTVSDNGRGMDPEERSTGFGLTMVHALAEQLGGTLHIESERGIGSTVILVAPVADCPRYSQAIS
ncbi:MAG: PAS domain S-box protein [Spirochaetaceae bacterium]|nr:MAG: PAS domain S-box protein [Spirochaetaceae bacterium]